MLRKLKDDAVAWTLSQFLKSKLEPYGELRGLVVDSSTKQIAASLLLKGEAEPLAVEMTGYRLIEEGEDLVLAYESLLTSREWLSRLLSDLLPGRSFKLPPQARRYSSIIKMMM